MPGGTLGNFKSSAGSRFVAVTLTYDALGYPLETSGRPTSETVTGTLHVGKYQWKASSNLTVVTNSASRGYAQRVATTFDGDGTFSFPYDFNYKPKDLGFVAGAALWVRFYQGTSGYYDLIPVLISEMSKDIDNAEGVQMMSGSFNFNGKPYYDLLET